MKKILWVWMFFVSCSLWADTQLIAVRVSHDADVFFTELWEQPRGSRFRYLAVIEVGNVREEMEEPYLIETQELSLGVMESEIDYIVYDPLGVVIDEAFERVKDKDSLILKTSAHRLIWSSSYEDVVKFDVGVLSLKGELQQQEKRKLEVAFKTTEDISLSLTLKSAENWNLACVREGQVMFLIEQKESKAQPFVYSATNSSVDVEIIARQVQSIYEKMRLVTLRQQVTTNKDNSKEKLFFLRKMLMLLALFD